jgi:hypothetical protein
MRITTWICLLGLTSASLFVACGDDDDDGQPNAAAGSGRSGASGAAGEGGSAGGAGGTAGGGASGSDGALRVSVSDACRGQCPTLTAVRCENTPKIEDCDRECGAFVVGLSGACLSALLANYACIQNLGRAAEYTCNAEGKPEAVATRACMSEAQALATDCAGQLGGGGASGAGGQGGARGGKL